VCRLKRSLYRLRQAPRAWHTRLKEELGHLGFEPSEADAALFTGTVDEKQVLLLVWVDDILIAGLGVERISTVKAQLAALFDVRDLSEATYFLGMELGRGRAARTLKLTQIRLARELLSRYGLENARAHSVPLATGAKLTKEGEPLDTQRFLYSELIN
jgi:hypothetical protein